MNKFPGASLSFNEAPCSKHNRPPPTVNAKQAVREAKEKHLIREGERLQRDYLGNRRRFWQKVKGEEKRACQISDSIETKDGELLTGKKEVQRRWREHFIKLFQMKGRIVQK